MAIYITGDTHGTYDVNKIFKLMPSLTESDFLIVLGDFGICWDNYGGDNKVRNFWNRLKCQTLFLDGNHENFTLLNRYHVSEKFGGKVQELGKKITHLMRGQVYTIEGKTFFTMGGAASHDCGRPLDFIISSHLEDYHSKDFYADFQKLPKYEQYLCRVPGKSWWKEEIPSPDEIASGKANLAALDNKVDYILTHTASSRVYHHLGFNPNSNPWSKPLIEFFDWLEENVLFEHWWFGHLHMDFNYDAKHIGFYQEIREAY
ncbi:MAG: metallophosphoesterase [Lachnospiraceae bacterium]|jgi:predicted phosphodiesterase|nr:metallophosphoesterase [Lachnospiraceae bacterium]